jgi:hypothetical protein
MPPYNPSDYEPVEDRIRAFWAEHPDGWISTELVDFNDKRFIVKARVGVGAFTDKFGYDERLIATGLAEEVIGAGQVNRNYALENCETSAIGRALANAGYATKGKRPSREEMQKVERQTERVTPAAEARDALRKLVHDMNLDGHAIADEYMRKYGENLADSESANQIRDFTEFVRKREQREADG